MCVHGCVGMRIWCQHCMRIQPAFGLITVHTYKTKGVEVGGHVARITAVRCVCMCVYIYTHIHTSIRGYIQKFPDWPPGARTGNDTALYH
jgi:hypothetical protein